MAREEPDRLATYGLRRREAESLGAFMVLDGHLHGECDAVCPRCMRWIEGFEYVRRTAYGPLQHEVCPSA